MYNSELLARVMLANLGLPFFSPWFLHPNTQKQYPLMTFTAYCLR
jgi:hypothetical protein